MTFFCYQVLLDCLKLRNHNQTELEDLLVTSSDIAGEGSAARLTES
jgi:hypothetical protein